MVPTLYGGVSTAAVYMPGIIYHVPGIIPVQEYLAVLGLCVVSRLSWSPPHTKKMKYVFLSYASIRNYT